MALVKEIGESSHAQGPLRGDLPNGTYLDVLEESAKDVPPRNAPASALLLRRR